MHTTAQLNECIYRKYQQALHASVRKHAKVQKEAARWPCYVHHSSLRAARPTNIDADVGDSRIRGQVVTHLWRDCSSVSSHLFARKSQRGRSRTIITHRTKQHSAPTILCEEACAHAAIFTRRHNLAKHLACGISQHLTDSTAQCTAFSTPTNSGTGEANDGHHGYANTTDVRVRVCVRGQMW